MNLEHPIPWKTRADLMSIEHASSNSVSFTVKDPIKDEFYFFGQVEFFFLQHLRCPQTFASLIQAAGRELGHPFGVREIQNYLRQLAKDNLIVPNQLGDGERLYRQRTLEHSGQWKQQLLGLLSIKLPGFHPGGILPALKPLGILAFHPFSLCVFVAALLATTLFAMFSLSSLARLAPPLAQLITPEHVTAVMIGFILAKILHELGHAIACQYTGHECSEMGLLLLVFLPCMYCDVTDLWSEPKKWKRMLVSLAGVYVELSIAMICFWIWFLTVPGPLHDFCFSLMLITSVNTLFINGNPLMRYDGYYALSDLTGVPNLGMVSRHQLSGRVRRFFLRHTPTIERNPLARFLLTYAICSMIYRWLILSAIVTGVWTFFEFQQLRSIGNLMVVLFGLIVAVPILLNIRSSIRAIGQHGLRWLNSSICLLLVAGLVYLCMGIEFSHRIWGPVEIQLADPNYVFASADGRFISHVQDGQTIHAGDVIAAIENSELELEHVSLTGQLRDAQMNLQFIELKSDSHRLAGQTEHWKKRESTLKRQLLENERKQEELVIRAHVDGQIVGFHHPDMLGRNDSLDAKPGSLFDQQNQNCQINRGEPICYVGQVTQMKGIIEIDQQDIQLVEIGQPVKISLPHQSDRILGSVVDIALENLRAEQTGPSPEQNKVTYRVSVEFPADARIRVGSIQKAIIICQKTTLAKFVGRWLSNSFWF